VTPEENDRRACERPSPPHHPHGRRVSREMGRVGFRRRQGIPLTWASVRRRPLASEVADRARYHGEGASRTGEARARGMENGEGSDRLRGRLIPGIRRVPVARRRMGVVDAHGRPKRLFNLSEARASRWLSRFGRGFNGRRAVRRNDGTSRSTARSHCSLRDGITQSRKQAPRWTVPVASHAIAGGAMLTHSWDTT